MFLEPPRKALHLPGTPLIPHLYSSPDLRASWAIFFLLMPLGTSWGWEGDTTLSQGKHMVQQVDDDRSVEVETLYPAPPHPHSGEPGALGPGSSLLKASQNQEAVGERDPALCPHPSHRCL